MTYLGSDATVNWLQLLFVLSVLQWLLTAFLLIKHRKKLLLEIPGYTQKTVPFIQDTFYIYWNLYPIVFYLLFHGIESNFSFTLTTFDMMSHHQAANDYALLFTQDISGKLPWKYIDIGIVIFAIFLAWYGAFYLQNKKQENYLQTQSKIYWWDKRLVPAIYYLRMVFLFFNLIFISFMIYLLTKLALFVALFLSHSDSISISPFHPDHYGGLSPLIDIASTIMLIYLFRVVMGIKGWLDHREVKQGLQKIGDIYHMAHFPIAFLFLSYFLYQFNALMDTIDVMRLLHPELFSALIPNTPNPDFHAISTSSGYLRALLSFNNTPVIVKIFTGTFFATFSSFLIWFFHRELAAFFQKKTEQ